MSDSVEHIKGLDELKAEFKRVPVDAQVKVLRKMAAAGAGIVKSYVIAAAPIGKSTKRHVAGTLKRSVREVYAREVSNENQAVYRVTFKKGAAGQIKLTRKGAALTLPSDAFYAAWVERGHRIVPRKSARGPRSLKRRREQASGSVPPHPFMGPAFNEAREPATAAMIATGEAEMRKVLP